MDDRLVEIVLPWGVGRLRSLCSQATRYVRMLPIEIELMYVLCWGVWTADERSTSATSTSAAGPKLSEATLTRSRPLIMHEEVAPVGNEGRIRISFLLVLLMLPPLALRERLWLSRGCTWSRGWFHSEVPCLEIDNIIVRARVRYLQAIHHHLCVLRSRKCRVGASNGRGWHPTVGGISPRFGWPRRAICVPFRTCLCERPRAVDLAEVAVVGVCIRFVDVTGDGDITLGIVCHLSCHRHVIALFIPPPAPGDGACLLPGGSHVCCRRTWEGRRSRWECRGESFAGRLGQASRAMMTRLRRSPE